MAIEWRADLELGIAEIDDQHRELFRRFNCLLEACRQGKGKEEVMSVLLFLGDYIRTHFQAEEALQRKTGYPGYEDHRAQHEGFRHELRKLEDEFRAEGASMPVVIRMNQMVVSWLIDHIGRKDRELAVYIAGKG